MTKKELLNENRRLLVEKQKLLEENQKLLVGLGQKTIELNENKRILKSQISYLWDRINNPTINLPSGIQVKVSELNQIQLEYLESLFSENINKM